MREEESNWFPRWDEELPSPEELMPLSQTLITPDLAMAFDIRNPNPNPNPSPNQNQSPTIPNNPPNLAPPPPATMPLQAPPSSSDFGDSADLNSAGNTAGDEPARTLKRPRLVWTPQLHKRFVDAVAHLGIKNAVPKTIMQLMSVDGLTRENVASHLQKYRLYLKRMQGLSSSGGGGSGGGISNGSDPATDHLFASSPVPAHFLHPAAAATSARPGSEHYLPFVPVAALHPHQHQNHHHHHQQHQNHHHHQIAAIQGQFQHHRHQQQQQHFEHPFLARPVHHRIGVGAAGSYPSAEDLDPVSNGGRKVLTLFPTGED